MTHLFVDSGYTTAGVKPQRICAVCDGLFGERQHHLPDTPEEARVIDERRIGERE